jgi:hypothetical protein
MEYFTKRNTVLVALAQVGVVVVGVLAAGAAHKWHATFNVTPPRSTTFLAEYGFLALVLPVAWAWAALRIQQWVVDEDVPRVVAFFSGFVVLGLLLLGVGYAAVLPLLHLMGV